MLSPGFAQTALPEHHRHRVIMQHCVHGLMMIHVVGWYHDSEFAAWGYHVTEEGEGFDCNLCCWGSCQ